MAESEARASRYRSAGVDIDAGNAVARAIGPLARATARPGADGGIGGFGAVFDLARTGLRDPLLVATTDGVGTKLRLLSETGRLHAAGVDLVAMCVNDLVCQGAQPLFFLDYYATGVLDRRAALATLQGIADGCREAGCALIGGETAEMPGHYAPGDIDLAGFAVGAVERDDLLPRSDVMPGDVILGLPASGLHANGFSLVRLVLREAGLGIDDPAPFAPGATLADALLAPTRIYVRPALRAIETGGVKAIAHVTGGGLVENLPRVLPAGVQARLDAGAWPLLPVFPWLAEAGGVDRAEMARTFNLGIGLVLVVAADSADAAIDALGEPVFTIGRIEAGAGAPAVLLDHLETAWAGAASPS